MDHPQRRKNLLGLGVIVYFQCLSDFFVSLRYSVSEGVESLQHGLFVHSSSSSSSPNQSGSAPRPFKADRARSDTIRFGRGGNAPLPPRLRVPPMNCSAYFTPNTSVWNLRRTRANDENDSSP